jgi:hypothetical protein
MTIHVQRGRRRLHGFFEDPPFPVQAAVGIRAAARFVTVRAVAFAFDARAGAGRRFGAEDFLAVGRLADRDFADDFGAWRRLRAAGLALRLAMNESFRTLTVWR